MERHLRSNSSHAAGALVGKWTGQNGLYRKGVATSSGERFVCLRKSDYFPRYLNWNIIKGYQL
jgi:hypothetical protein